MLHFMAYYLKEYCFYLFEFVALKIGGFLLVVLSQLFIEILVKIIVRLLHVYSYSSNDPYELVSKHFYAHLTPKMNTSERWTLVRQHEHDAHAIVDFIWVFRKWHIIAHKRPTIKPNLKKFLKCFGRTLTRHVIPLYSTICVVPLPYMLV